MLTELQSNGLVRTVGETESYTRVVQNENQVKVVKQMPKIIQAKQPTIAIITAQYCEKLAVDSMMDNQETFVRYTTVGNVHSFIIIGCDLVEECFHIQQVNLMSTRWETLVLIVLSALNFQLWDIHRGKQW